MGAGSLFAGHFASAAVLARRSSIARMPDKDGGYGGPTDSAPYYIAVQLKHPYTVSGKTMLANRQPTILPPLTGGLAGNDAGVLDALSGRIPFREMCSGTLAPLTLSGSGLSVYPIKTR